MSRKSVKQKKERKHEKLAMLAFVLVLILAGGAYYQVWQGQTIGKTYAGVLALAQIWETRKMMQADRPEFQDALMMDAKLGCCNFLQHPTRGSQLTIEVPKSNAKCYNDPLTRQQINRGYILVDVESGTCPVRR